jgi:hypothetical protein
MSNRRDEFKSSNPNPAARFLEWDSNQGCFKFYSKEKGENIVVKVPFRFVVLKQLHTIKGWHGKSESGIYANEIENMNDILHVKSFKGGPIVSGMYKDIKDRLNGGVYFKSIYIMFQDGSIGNISMKGAAVAAWGDFTKKQMSRLPDEWVVVKGAKEEKNGSVKYTIPVFEFEKSLDAAFGEKADAAYNTLSDYFKGYLSRAAEEEAFGDSEPQPDKTSHIAPAKVESNNPDVNRFEKATPAPMSMDFDDNMDLPF